MQIMITHGSLARTRVLHFNRWQLGGMLAALIVVLTLLSGTVYHFVFLKAAREGWPVVSQVVKLIVRDEFAQRDRFVRENLDAMAQKVERHRWIGTPPLHAREPGQHDDGSGHERPVRCGALAASPEAQEKKDDAGGQQQRTTDIK